MPTVDFSGGVSNIVARVEYDQAVIHGAGGALFPRLCVQLKLHLKPLQGVPTCDSLYTDLVAELLVSSSHEKVSQALPVVFAEVRRSGKLGDLPHHVNLEFPLDATRLSALERVRNGGHMALELQLNMLLTELGVIPRDEAKKTDRVVLGPRYDHPLYATCQFTIPQSTWIERVLPGLGYGKVHLIELPAIPLENTAEWNNAFKALNQAQELHKIGRYDDAAGKCRIALEKLLVESDEKQPDGSTKKTRRLAAHWETRLGKPTLEWLNASLIALKGATNRSHHSAFVHFDQMESQLLLMITTALIAYAARHGDP